MPHPGLWDFWTPKPTLISPRHPVDREATSCHESHITLSCHGIHAAHTLTQMEQARVRGPWGTRKVDGFVSLWMAMYIYIYIYVIHHIHVWFHNAFNRYTKIMRSNPQYKIFIWKNGWVWLTFQRPPWLPLFQETTSPAAKESTRIFSAGWLVGAASHMEGSWKWGFPKWMVYKGKSY